MIEAYFIEIEQTIREFPNVRFVSLTKKIYNATQGYTDVTWKEEKVYEVERN